MTATAEQKAQRLLRDGRVGEINARVFRVLGDHDEYSVIVPVEPSDYLMPTCDCPALGDCSHLIATNGLLLEEQEAAREDSPKDWPTP